MKLQSDRNISNDWPELLICVNLFTHSAEVLVINVYGNFPHYKSGTCGNDSNWVQSPESGAEFQALLIFQHRLISLYYKSLNTSDTDFEISQNICCVSQRSHVLVAVLLVRLTLIYSFILHTCVCVCCTVGCGAKASSCTTQSISCCDDSMKRTSSATVTTIWSNPQWIQCFQL